MTTPRIIQELETAGGILTLNGDRIQYDVPKEARVLVDLLRERRDEVLWVLRERTCWRADGSQPCGVRHPDPYTLAVENAKSSNLPPMPKGVRLLDWRPVEPPVVITACSVVIDIPQFVKTTLQQLRAALDGKNWLAGNRSVRDLCERLEQVGVKVEVTR